MLCALDALSRLEDEHCDEEEHEEAEVPLRRDVLLEDVRRVQENNA